MSVFYQSPSTLFTEAESLIEAGDFIISAGLDLLGISHGCLLGLGLYVGCYSSLALCGCSGHDF